MGATRGTAWYSRAMRRQVRRRGAIVVAATALSLCHACGGTTATAPPHVVLGASGLDFGLVDCGGAASTEPLTIANTGGSPLTWEASVGKTGAFSLDGAPAGTLAPGETTSLSVKAKVPDGAPAAEALDTTLWVTTNDPANGTSSIPLHLISRGAMLTVKPATADFGQIPLGLTAPDIAVTVTNSGNDAVALAFGAPQDPQFTAGWDGAPAAASLPPGGELTATLGFTPTTDKAVADASALLVTGAVCAAPQTVAIKGEGTKGIAGVSPGLLDFGVVGCATAAPPQEVTLLNAGNQAYDFTATLSQGGSSPYVVTPSSGTVPPKSQVQLAVAPKTVPPQSALTPDLYDDTLAIMTTALDDVPHAVALQESAGGAILSTSAPLVFSRLAVGATPATQQLVITNAGNQPAQVTFSSPEPFSAAGPVLVPAGGTATTTISFTPDPGSLGPVTQDLGMSTTDPVCAPISAANATATTYDRARMLAAGDTHACATAVSGVTYCWGRNLEGELGDGTTLMRKKPVPVSGLKDVLGLGLGQYHSCAVVQGGTVECWGADFDGQLGGGNTGGYSTKPVAVLNLADATQVAGGGQSSYALTSAGGVVAWGLNGAGQLGDGTTVDSNVPVTVSGITDAVQVAGRRWTACALRAGGGVWCWGDYYLGDGTKGSSAVPVDTGLTDVVQVGGGRGTEGNGCAVETTGGVACWGYNPYSTTPSSFGGLTDAVQVGVGEEFACARRAAGGVMCWGDNSWGQLGHGGYFYSWVPVEVSGVTDAASIAVGANFACVMNGDGTLLCWGSGISYELGDGDHGNTPNPMPVTGFD